MIAIVLGILKILGILILIILGLLLFALLSVLFVPVCYRVEGSLYEHPEGTASVSWFFHLVSLRISSETEKKLDFRILWFHPGREHEKEETETLWEISEPETDAAKSKQPNQTMDEKNVVESDRTKSEELTAKERQTETATAQKNVVDVSATDADSNPNSETKASGLFQSCRKKLCRLPASLKKKLHGLKKTLKKTVKKLRKGKLRWEKILAFLQNEENQETFRLLKKQIFALLRHVLPRKAKGKLLFGFGDPYLTGQVLTWISPFYGLYARTIQIIPDFTEVRLEGELKLKGHIRLATLLILFLPLILDKRVRRWIRAVRKHE